MQATSMLPARKGVGQGWTIKPPTCAWHAACELSRQVSPHLSALQVLWQRAPSAVVPTPQGDAMGVQKLKAVLRAECSLYNAAYCL